MLLHRYFRETNFEVNIFILLVLLFTVAGQAFGQNEDFSVIKGWMKYSDAQNSLYHHLSSQIIKFLDLRSTAIEKLHSKNDWLNRQNFVFETLNSIVGPFPPKTPLFAKVIDTVKKNGFTIEKIIYESQPQFYVTSCLFLPDGINDKNPAIIYCSGHSADGFRSQAYQRVILNLVKKGFIVFAFDPVGQGERLEYFDEKTGASLVGGPTLEHSYPGAQCFLTGSSQARYMIWDGIRAVDYLLTRKEIDPDRIGITGRSGGGTQSAYIAAFDDRILAAAPECYITGFKRLIESKGPQDAEQNFYHGIANGIDHADLLEVRAPKPVLLITTTRDFFSIQGTRETATEVNKVYAAFEKAENFSMVEDNFGHESTQKNREAMYAFFQKHLELPGDPRDEVIEYLSAEELKVTQTGQLRTSLGGETVFALNKKQAEAQNNQLQHFRSNSSEHIKKVKELAVLLSGYIKPEENSDAVFAGRFQRESYDVEKYFIKGEGNYVIPFLLLVPSVKRAIAIIYLHPEGKSAESGLGQEMEWFAQNGFFILVPDLVGCGEMGPGSFRGDAYNFNMGQAFYNIWFASVQVGRSLVGIHAGDVSRLINYLQQENIFQPTEIIIIAKKEMCPAALHAAVFDSRITKVVLDEPLLSYQAIVRNQFYQPSFILSSVAGALTGYDLPDLGAALCPRKLLMLNITDQNGKPVNKDLLKEEFVLARSVYADQKVAENLEIRFQKEPQSIAEIFSSWLK